MARLFNQKMTNVSEFVVGKIYYKNPDNQMGGNSFPLQDVNVISIEETTITAKIGPHGASIAYAKELLRAFVNCGSGFSNESK